MHFHKIANMSPTPFEIAGMEDDELVAHLTGLLQKAGAAQHVLTIDKIEYSAKNVLDILKTNNPLRRRILQLLVRETGEMELANSYLS